MGIPAMVTKPATIANVFYSGNFHPFYITILNPQKLKNEKANQKTQAEQKNNFKLNRIRNE
jgi:hypothetical protein